MPCGPTIPKFSAVQISKVWFIESPKFEEEIYEECVVGCVLKKKFDVFLKRRVRMKITVCLQTRAWCGF